MNGVKLKRVMIMPGITELLIILLIILVLFGSKKIPDLASGLGKGIKNFRQAMQEEEEFTQEENTEKEVKEN